MFGFGKRKVKSPGGVFANKVWEIDGEQVVDVRGQTCPGYLLAINRAVDQFSAGTRVRLWITYPPCGDDVQAWANSKGHRLIGMENEEELFVIRLEAAGKK